MILINCVSNECQGALMLDVLSIPFLILFLLHASDFTHDDDVIHGLQHVHVLVDDVDEG